MPYKCIHVYRMLILLALFLSIAVKPSAETPHFPDRIPIVERTFSDDSG